eukprot:COSAG05_NODE_9_length_39734_cov_180.598067_4_plen_151_part_00
MGSSQMIGRTSSQDAAAVSMDLPTLPSLGSGSCLPTSRDLHGIDSSDGWQHQFGPLDSAGSSAEGDRQAVSLIPWTPATVIPSSVVPPHPSSAPPSSPRQVGCSSITETKEQDYYAHLVSVAGSEMLGWHFDLEDMGLCPADGKQMGDEW